MAQQADHSQRHQRRLLHVAAVVGAQQRAQVHVVDRRGQPLVEHPHHLLGGDAVGEHAGDEGAGAGADVDVEVVDRPVDRQQVEGPQGADLIDPAGEAAAAEHQRGLRPRRLRPETSCRPWPEDASSLTTLPMAVANYARPASQPGRVPATSIGRYCWRRPGVIGSDETRLRVGAALTVRSATISALPAQGQAAAAPEPRSPRQHARRFVAAPAAELGRATLPQAAAEAAAGRLAAAGSSSLDAGSGQVALPARRPALAGRWPRT